LRLGAEDSGGTSSRGKGFRNKRKRKKKTGIKSEDTYVEEFSRNGKTKGGRNGERGNAGKTMERETP